MPIRRPRPRWRPPSKPTPSCTRSRRTARTLRMRRRTAAKCVARRPVRFRPKRTLLRANRTRTGRSSSISKRKTPAERPKRTVPGDANRRPGLQRQPTRHSRRTRSTRLSRRANLDPLDVSNDGDSSIRWPNWNCCRCRSGS